MVLGPGGIGGGALLDSVCVQVCEQNQLTTGTRAWHRTAHVPVSASPGTVPNPFSTSFVADGLCSPLPLVSLAVS